ncbi:MAG: MmgE/PrpD family protein [Acetobacteraceae bacterium]
MAAVPTALRAQGDADQPMPLARQMAESVRLPRQPNAAETAKVKTCLLDLIACAIEARDLPWGRQAIALANPARPGAQIIGAPIRATPGDAAFANAVMGHGLVREDMHAGAISHLGVVVLPVLLALSQTRPTSGARFIAAAIAGYEAGAQLGRALFTTQLARLFRPTGITGPIGAAAAGAVLLGLDAAQTTSAIGLAANTVAGLNEWPHTGGSEMFFHPGFAARNALTCIQLAAQGAQASDTALDGEAGLFAAYRRDDIRPAIALFSGPAEILAVYNKPVPACNFAQTACQAALLIAREEQAPVASITAIHILVPRAAARYPGCDSTGPFDRLLQAKMSIQFGVAAALLRGAVEESNYALPADPALLRLLALTTLQEDPAFTAAFPAHQGATVEVSFGGRVARRSLDDVVPATPDEVSARCRRAAAAAFGPARADAIINYVARLEDAPDIGPLAPLLASAEGR